MSSWILNSAFVGEESVLESSVVSFNLWPLALSADCARQQNKLVLLWNVCPLECHPFWSLHRAYKIAADADSDVCSTVVLPIIVMKLSCLHWCFVRRTENSRGSRMYVCDECHLFSFLCSFVKEVTGWKWGRFICLCREDTRIKDREHVAAKPEEPDIQKSEGSRYDAEIKTSEGCRGYCAECAEIQIESFSLKPSLGRRNCFQIYGLDKANRTFFTILFYFCFTELVLRFLC